MWRLAVISIIGVGLSSCGTLPKGATGPAVPVARIVEAVRCQLAAAFAPGNPDPAGMIGWKVLTTITINGDSGFESPESYAAGDVASARVGRFENGHCGVEARFRVPGKQALDGKHLWLDYDTQTATWTCSSDVADEHLPAQCRG